MLSHRLVLTFIITAVIAILVTDIRSSTVSSDSGSASYNFLVASGFLCEPNDSTTCPAVARAASGETIELNGAGTFTLANKSITAAGAFIHKSPLDRWWPAGSGQSPNCSASSRMGLRQVL